MMLASRSLIFLLTAIATLSLASAPALADGGGTPITSAFSGIWDQPDHESQGFIIQISEDDEGGKIGVAYWFTYGGDLESAWYLAVGPVTGHQIEGILYKASGVTFLEDGIVGDANVEEIGTLLLTFRNCNQGTAAYETPEEALGSGEVRIKRLTSVYNMRCSGGISDDTPGDARPLQLEVELEPVDENSEADGKAKFWERPGRSDLKVTVDDLPEDGTYRLEVCEEALGDEGDEGDFEVVEGEGNIQFRSPAIPGKALLDFDPRDCRFDIFFGETLVLTSGEEVLAPKSRGDDDDDDGMDEDEIEVDLENTGVIADARGSAEYVVDDDRIEFKVKIRGVPVGAYPLYVTEAGGGGAELVGEITVEQEGNGQTRGELRFSNPPKDGDDELDFEPLGALIEVTDGTDVILEVLFPES
jgi:hypothetical protein